MDDVLAMGPQGRIVIPARLRRRLGLHPGSRLRIRVEGDHLVLEPPDAIADGLRRAFAAAPDDVVDLLLGDRRAEP